MSKFYFFLNRLRCRCLIYYHLYRLSQVLSRVIRSPKRPLLHLLRSWTLVSQHLVDTCCSFSYYDSAPFELEAERLLISQRALACLQECTIMSVTTRLELPYFNANEMFCKPFDSLLRLGMHAVVSTMSNIDARNEQVLSRLQFNKRFKFV